MPIQRLFSKHCGILLAVFFVFCVGKLPIFAFDTGHHHDLTRSALKTFGFADTSIKIGQLENWLVDYYSNQPTAGLKADLEKLHFDNLLDSARIRVYWDRLRVNSKAAFEKAATDGDSMRVVALLGMSLHAVQDFYTHSNWGEEHALPATGFLTDTYFDNPAVAAHPTFRTGVYPNHNPLQANDHGDGSSVSLGMNHDAYARARWSQAYVHAFCASRQWIQTARTWVESVQGGDQVWAKALNITLSASGMKDLDRDLRAAYRISEYASGGHWKGPGSESRAEFAVATATFVASLDSTFVKHFKDSKWHKMLTDGLELTTIPSTIPPIATITQPFAAVEVRTLSAEELPVDLLESKIDTGGKADFYSRVQIDGQLFTDSMQQDRASVSPAWRAFAFVPANQAQISIRYELWDEDGGTGGDDDQCDIFFKTGERAIVASMDLGNQSLSGDITGTHNTEATAFESGGKRPDKDRAKVKLVISKFSLLP